MWTKVTFALLVLLFTSACSEQSLYSGLSELEANEMVSQLSIAGLSASKQKLKGDQYSVSTSPDEFAHAVQLLKSHGLPRQRYDSLGEVFAKEGFVSSPLEERARLNHALSQEIASTLSSIDGVILARVHLAVPPKNDLDDSVAAASASVFIKHRSGVDLMDSVSQIKALVVNGIENLPYENVTVALFESAAPTEFSSRPLVMENSAIDNSKQMTVLRSAMASEEVGIASALMLLMLIVLGGISYWRSQQSE